MSTVIRALQWEMSWASCLDQSLLTPGLMLMLSILGHALKGRLGSRREEYYRPCVCAAASDRLCTIQLWSCKALLLLRYVDFQKAFDRV